MTYIARVEARLVEQVAVLRLIAQVIEGHA